jgi:hypothetical protein
MSELETRKSSAAPEHSTMEAQTAEIAPITEYEGGELDPDGPAEVLEADGADADLLAIPPRADDLGTALAARPPRIKLPKITTSLVAAALICAGFIGGALAEKHLGGSSSSGRPNISFAGTGTGTRTGAGGGGTGGFFGRGGTGGTGSAGGTGGSAITGTVTVVSGDKLYVTAADGSVYTVTTSGTTTVNVTKVGTFSQLKPGQSVVIAGSNDGNGNVTATSITANSASTGN